MDQNNILKASVQLKYHFQIRGIILVISMSEMFADDLRCSITNRNIYIVYVAKVAYALQVHFIFTNNIQVHLSESEDFSSHSSILQRPSISIQS